VVASGNARSGLGNLSLEFGGTAREFRHFVASISLLGIVFSNTVILETSEGDGLVQGFGMGRLASGSALGDRLLRNANLTRTSDDGVSQDGAFTLLGLQRLGNLGGDLLLLEAFRGFLFQLLPDGAGQGRFRFARLGKVGDSVGSNLDFRFAVHALGRSFKFILDLLVLVATRTAKLVLVDRGNLNSDILAIKSEVQLLVHTLKLDDIVLGPEDLSNDRVPVESGSDLTPLVGLDLDFLTINNDLLLGVGVALFGNDHDLRLSKDNHEFLAVHGLHEPGHDREALGLRAVSRQDMETLIKMHREGLVVIGLQGLAFDLANREEVVSGELLSNKFDIVNTSLEGENLPQNKGHADLSEPKLFLGPLDGHVEAGGSLVEKQSDQDGSIPDGGPSDRVTFFTDPSEGPQKSLDGINRHLFVLFNFPGKVVVLNSKFDFIKSGSLFADLFTSRGQPSHNSLFSRPLPFHQVFTTLSFFRFLGPFLLFMRNLGVSDNFNVPSFRARFKKLELVEKSEVNEGVLELRDGPDGQDGGVHLTIDPDGLLGLGRFHINIPFRMHLSFGRFVSLTSSQGSKVLPGVGSSGGFQSNLELEGQSPKVIRRLADGFQSLDDLFTPFKLASGGSREFFRFNLEGDEFPQSLEDRASFGDPFRFFMSLRFRDLSDSLVHDRFRSFRLGSISNLHLDLDFLGGGLSGVNHKAVFVSPDRRKPVFIKSQVGEHNHVEGVVVVQGHLFQKSLQVIESGFSFDLRFDVEAEVFTKLIFEGLDLVPGVDHFLGGGQGDGAQDVNLLHGGEGMDMVVDHLEGLVELFNKLKLEGQLLLRNVQFKLGLEGKVENKGLVNGGSKVFLVERVNHSNFGN